MSKDEIIPDKVFIIPYRDRAPQQVVFLRVMPWILEGQNYQILFIHQYDKRPFNRGAMKNIGFSYVKAKWPEDYRQMILIFHDIDYMAWRKGQFQFWTMPGTIKHYLGFPKSLGGIFAIMGADFERINGFPNIWTWGLEDNIIYGRALRGRLYVDARERLHVEKDTKDIISLWHGWERLINPNIHNKMIHDSGHDGISSLRGVKYEDRDLESGWGWHSDQKVRTVRVTYFSTQESLSSPFVRGAKMRNSRHYGSFKDSQPRYVRNKKKSILNFT